MPSTGNAFGRPVIVQASGEHTATIIMCHGLGDTGDGWAQVAPQMGIPSAKWIFPTAPTRPISVNGGMKMPGWFDIDRLDVQAFMSILSTGVGFDPAGTQESVDYITGLIAQEIKAGIPANRIVVGGFSQGAHIALKTALPHTPTLAGCVCLSSWLEPSKTLRVPEANTGMPVLQGHGSSDPLIPAAIGQGTAKILASMGCTNVEFKLYPGMAHATCPQEMSDFKSFLTKVLPEPLPTAQDISRMSIKQLKAFLRSKGISTSGMLEKSEYRHAALGCLQ